MADRFCVLAFLIVLGLATLARPQSFTTLYNFTGSDGSGPFAGVIQDPAGKLYGATAWGSDFNCDAQNGCGVVYELNTAGTETVLHSFSGNADGAYAFMPLVRDKAGNIYGTTFAGGSVSGCGYGGCGTVFKIDRSGTETVLYRFTGGSDGCNPNQGLVVDKFGALYGTTSGCGSSGSYGTIFKVNSAGNFSLLHIFAGAPSDAAYPSDGHLTMDRSGNLYGVTQGGGVHNYGALYKLNNSGAITLLHSFNWPTRSDGCTPRGSVVRDDAGNLYGTTYSCGSGGGGTIWKVSKKGKETILHNFTARSTTDGCLPSAGVTRDSEGNLYGDTRGCGAFGDGTFYELSASGTFTLLHSFDDIDGATPIGEVLRTAKGTLFGTCVGGGNSSAGTVWQYVP